MKNKKIILIIVLIFILLVGIIMFNFTNIIENINKGNIKANIEELFSYTVYDNQDNDKIKVLIKVNSENGIEYIERPDGDKIQGNGKQNIVIDYIVKKDEEKVFKIKEIGESEKSKNLCITNTIIDETIGVSKIVDTDGYKTYYQIGKNGDWKEGSGKVSILDYDVTTNGLINDDNTITISTKTVNDKNSYVVMGNPKNYTIDTTSTVSSFKANSLIDAMQKFDFGTGKYNVGINDEEYSLKVYSFDESQIIDADTEFGTEEDVAVKEEGQNDVTYAKNMIVIKVDGDLTINNDVILSAHASDEGYGGPKGMFIYCTGTVTNNGTISMTARGAYAEGQNVYMWKNAGVSETAELNERYEYVLAEGAKGAIHKENNVYSNGGNGINGENAINRQTGGGGSGAYYKSYVKAGSGSAGTSYSGGAGGGGYDGGYTVNHTAEDAYINGGPGGHGSRSNSSGVLKGGGRSW